MTTTTITKESILNNDEARERPVDGWQAVRSVVFVLAFVVFLSAAGFSIVLPTLYPRLVQQGGGHTFYGVVASVYSFGGAATSMYFGSLFQAKTFSIRAILLFSLFLEAAGNLTYYLIEDKWYIMLARFICGLGSGNVTVCRAYVAAYVTGPAKGRAMSCITAGQALGFVAGPLIANAFSNVHVGSGIWSLNPFNLPGLVSFVLAVINMGMIACIFSGGDPRSDQSKSSGAEDSPLLAPPSAAPAPAPLGTKGTLQVAALLYLFFTVTTAFSLFEVIVTPLTLDLYGWGVSQVATFFSVTGGVAAVVIFSMGFLMRCLSNVKLLILGQTIMLAGCALLVTELNGDKVLIFWIGFSLLLSLGHPTTMINTLVIFAQLSAKLGRPGSMMGWISATGSMARILGPLATNIYSAVGGQGLFLVMLSMLGVALILSSAALYSMTEDAKDKSMVEEDEDP